MFNKFVNHTLYTEYLLFNKMGCKFTVTNVYFKKEKDIILSGTLWKEGCQFCVYITCESPKTLRARGWGASRVLPSAGPPPPPARPLAARAPRIIYCRKCIHLLYNEDKFAKYIDSIFIQAHGRAPARPPAGRWLYRLLCSWFVPVLLFTMRGFLYLVLI